VAFSAEAPNRKMRFCMILNAYWEPLDFELPAPGESTGDSWRRWIDTTLESPDDIVEWPSAPPVSADTYRAGPRSMVVLFAGDIATAPGF
jgi:glycogen operon protein